MRILPQKPAAEQVRDTLYDEYFAGGKLSSQMSLPSPQAAREFLAERGFAEEDLDKGYVLALRKAFDPTYEHGGDTQFLGLTAGSGTSNVTTNLGWLKDRFTPMGQSFGDKREKDAGLTWILRLCTLGLYWLIVEGAAMCFRAWQGQGSTDTVLGKAKMKVDEIVAQLANEDGSYTYANLVGQISELHALQTILADRDKDCSFNDFARGLSDVIPALVEYNGGLDDGGKSGNVHDDDGDTATVSSQHSDASSAAAVQSADATGHNHDKPRGDAQVAPALQVIDDTVAAELMARIDDVARVDGNHENPIRRGYGLLKGLILNFSKSPGVGTELFRPFSRENATPGGWKRDERMGKLKEQLAKLGITFGDGQQAQVDRAVFDRAIENNQTGLLGQGKANTAHEILRSLDINISERSLRTKLSSLSLPTDCLNDMPPRATTSSSYTSSSSWGRRR